MSRLIDKLSAYGADVQGIMERFLNDEELYINCLNTFFEDESFDALGVSIKNKHYEEAFNYAHTLKGVSGNMGLTPLYNFIVVLVESLRGNYYSQIDEQYSDVINEYNRSKNFFCSK